MNGALSAADRLIVAADFVPLPEERNGGIEAASKVEQLAQQLGDTGVCIKVNSILRFYGLELIGVIHGHGLQVFADLKLIDIPQTLATDGALLREVRPEIVTVMCHAGIDGMRRLKDTLPDTKVFGVTTLTSIKEGDPVLAGLGIETWLCTYADMALEAGIDGLIASPKELAFLRRHDRWESLLVATPGIRPDWAIVVSDDQNAERVMTPAGAIRAGADQIVVGRPIVKDIDPRTAILRTLEEIESATATA